MRNRFTRLVRTSIAGIVALAHGSCGTIPGGAPGEPGPRAPVEIAPDGAWTWFNDERAIRLESGAVLVGYVRRDGRIAATHYDPSTGKRSESVLGGPGAVETDDHNNPSLTLLPDGRVLAIYSRHNEDTHYFYRVSRSPDPRSDADWDGEQMKDVGAPNSYANVYRLETERDRIFNFHRAINANPTLSLSGDLGRTWGPPTPFIRAGTGGDVEGAAGAGRQRPYVRYVSNSRDRIDLIYTDGHPTRVDNSIYHLFYRGGDFHGSSGVAVKALRDLPLDHAAGERGTVVYQFSAEPWRSGEGPDHRIPGGRGWTWDVAYGAEERPVAAFQVRRGAVTGADWKDARIYYYYARWTGTEWQKRFVAQGGRPLYEGEDNYGGGMSLDPQNPGIVYLSTNALRPFGLSTIDDVPLNPDERYHLYRGETTDGGKTFRWVDLTPDATEDELRPHAIQNPGGETALVWIRGRYTTYQDYGTRVMGLFSR